MFQSACIEHADSKLKIILEEGFTEVSETKHTEMSLKWQ